MNMHLGCRQTVSSLQCIELDFCLIVYFCYIVDSIYEYCRRLLSSHGATETI